MKCKLFGEVYEEYNFKPGKRMYKTDVHICITWYTIVSFVLRIYNLILKILTLFFEKVFCWKQNLYEKKIVGNLWKFYLEKKLLQKICLAKLLYEKIFV